MNINQPMLFAELDAAPRLKPWVDCYWQFRIAPDAGEVEHWVPPDGGLSVSYSVETGRLSLSGPWLEPFRPSVHPGMVVWGVRFWPGAGQALLGIAPRSVRDRFADASELLPETATGDLFAALHAAAVADAAESVDAAAVALQRAFDDWLDGLVEEVHGDAAPGSALDELVMTAVFRLLRSDGQERIGDIARAVALSPRQLRRRFGDVVGLSPKELARIRRFRASAIGAVERGAAWAWLAAEHGYADQPHLAHEYRRLIGLSPTAFEEQFAKIRHRLR